MSVRRLARSSRRLALWALVPVAIALLFGAKTAIAAVGEDGAFSTNVVVEVPPFHGIQPSIALSYDSTRPDGLVGVGWRLDAASYIARGGRHGGAPRFDDTDVFTLDGEKLVLCAPGCPTGGTHETRRRDFSRISFEGARWLRWRPDGARLVYEPLALASAKGTYRWALSTVTDTHGKKVAYQHGCDGTECYLESIAYADGPPLCFDPLGQLCVAGPLGARVRFHYEERHDPVSYGTGDGLAVTSKRLKTIEVRMGGELVRAYALVYARSESTAGSLLRSVQTFPSDATVDGSGTVSAGATTPLPPTVFSSASMAVGPPGQWSTTTVATGSLSSLGASGPGKPSYAPVYDNTTVPNPAGRVYDLRTDESGLLPNGTVQGDFDGDGRTDWAVYGVRPGCRTVQVNAVLAARPATGPLTSTGPIGAGPGPISSISCRLDGISAAVYAADVNGDRRDDVVLMDRSGEPKAATSRGDGTFAFAGEWRPTRFGKEPTCTVGDVDADGRADLVCVDDASGAATLRIARALATGGFGMTSSPLSATGVTTSPAELEMTIGDVDANGTAELILAVPSLTWRLVTVYTDGAGGIASWTTQETGWSTEPYLPDRWQLSSGDFDGDARRDVVLTRGENLRDVAYVATSTKSEATGFSPMAGVQLGGSDTVVVDGNGDGMDDLMTGFPAGEALAAGGGHFSVWTPTTGGCFDVDTQTARTAPADTNGDGRGDLICFRDDPASLGAEVSAYDRVSPNRPADLFRWTPADVTGTGRAAFVYMHFRNPGYEVYTLTQKPSGGFERSAAAISPQPHMPLTNPNAGAWMPIDVGGGRGGAADGKTDLVLVDRDGTTLRISTLLSTGTGWTPTVDTPWRANGATVGYGSADVQTWRPANLNRDGRSDLVHFVPLGPGLRLEYLLSNGDGTWTSGSHDYFTTATSNAPALTAPNVQDFRSTDVDGDTLTDFAFLESRLGDTIIRTLVGNGDASWSERSHSEPAALTAAEARAVRPMEFNGDGMADLALIRTVDGCLRVTAYVSTGSGWRADNSHAPIRPACSPPFSVEDTNNIRILDVDHDNDDDVLHLSRRVEGGSSTTAAHLVENLPGNTWSPGVNSPSLPLRYPDTWAYGTIDTDNDGRSEFFHLDGAELATLHWTTRSDLLTKITNGRGATTSIGYRSLAGSRSYLPSGSLPTVVETVTTRDAAHSPAVAERTNWAYDGARWSDEHNRLLGFESVRSTQANTVAATRYELTNACGARAAAISLENTQGRVFTASEFAFVNPGAAPPFRCLTNKVVERDCAGEPDCSTKTTHFDHDSYANVTTTTETGARAGTRRTTTDFRPNADDYIVDRPARQQTYEFDPTAPAQDVWRRKAATEYLYDTNTAWDSRAGAKAELRRTRAWDDRADRFIETSFDYDEHGNLTATTNPPTTTSPTGVVQRIEYDSERSLFPVKRCDPVGCSEQTWKLKFGAPETATDLNRQVTTHAYDAYGRQTRMTNPDGSTTSTSYLNNGTWQGRESQRQRIRTEVSDGSRPDGVLSQEQLLDGLGRVYKTIREGDGSGRIVTETRFADASARPAATSDPHLSTSEPVWTQYRYDSAHRPTAAILADGATAETEYRAGSTVTRDPVGRETTAVRDEFGRTIRVEQLNRDPCAGCPAKNATTKYGYDALDRRTRITDAAGNVTNTVWDSLGRKVTERDPDRGTRSWTWRDDGAPDTATDAKGQTSRWFYDDAGRPTRKQEHTADGANARTITWSWDSDPASDKTRRDSLGRVVRVAYSSPVVSGTTELWYDRLGRVRSSRQCADSSCAHMSFAFDAAGRLATLTYPDADGALTDESERVTQRYDTAGRLFSLTGHDPATTTDTRYATDLSHTALGQLKQLKHSNGVVDSLTYDDTRHWLDSIQVTRPSAAQLYSAGHRHYPDAKIQTLTESAPAAMEQEFVYDDLERLTHVTASAPGRDRDYGYDDIGRMSSSSEARTYTYGDIRHVHAPTSTDKGHTRSYDANGNVTALSDPTGRDLTIDWTVTDMPERVVSNPNGAATVMGYDAADQRVVKRHGPRTTYYFGRYLEQDAKGGLVKYYWAGDRLVARRDGAGQLTHFHQDRLGSTRLLTNAGGKVVERHDYDPFGKPLKPSGRDERLWQSQRRDHDSGLVYMNARFYDPELGHFASADSIIPDPYRLQSLDRYAYVENDPANHTDPSGHMPRRVELMKEQAAQSGFAAMYSRMLQSQCGVFQQCVRYAPGMLVTEVYKENVKSGQFWRTKEPTFGGGLDVETGEWNHAVVSEVLPWSNAEVAESHSAVAPESAASDSLHADIGETVARGPSAESGCPSCTLLGPEPGILETIGENAVLEAEAMQAGAQKAAELFSDGVSWIDKTFPNLLEGMAAMPMTAGPSRTLLAVKALRGVRGVGLASRGVSLASRMARAHGVRFNNLAGLGFETALARAFEKAGFEVARNVYYWTPFGRRFVDLEIRYHGRVVQLLEAKLGSSPYLAWQRSKDLWIYGRHGLWTDLIRSGDLAR